MNPCHVLVLCVAVIVQVHFSSANKFDDERGKFKDFASKINKDIVILKDLRDLLKAKDKPLVQRGSSLSMSGGGDTGANNFQKKAMHDVEIEAKRERIIAREKVMAAEEKAKKDEIPKKSPLSDKRKLLDLVQRASRDEEMLKDLETKKEANNDPGSVNCGRGITHNTCRDCDKKSDRCGGDCHYDWDYDRGYRCIPN